MPTTKELQHRRTHNLLLIQKLLNGRENASPFTLVLDSLEQSGRPLVREMMRRANAAKTQVVFVSFETLRRPPNIDTFIHAWELQAVDLQKRLLKLTSAATRTLIIIDTLHPLLADPLLPITGFLSSLMSPTTSVLATYHTDMSTSNSPATYTPPPLTLLKYLATTIFITHSLHHVLAQKTARDRAEPMPLFGLSSPMTNSHGEDVAGVLVGLGSNDPRGLVLEMEYRRKSGRGVGEWFFLPSHTAAAPSKSTSTTKSATLPGRDPSGIMLLEDHPLYARPVSDDVNEGNVEMESTFDMGLTEKQRRDREGIVLPYFDAQSGEGGEGGRILYEMGVEDDFDEEEDEI